MESAKNKLNNKYRFTPRIKPHGVTAHGATSQLFTSCEATWIYTQTDGRSFINVAQKELYTR